MHPVIFFVLLMLAFGIAGRIDADSYEAMSLAATEASRQQPFHTVWGNP